MVTQAQGIIKNMIPATEIVFQSDDFRPIFSDGKMFVNKSHLEDIYDKRCELSPYKNKTHQDFIKDLKSMSKRNRYMVKFLQENDTFYVFECGNFVNIDVNNVRSITPLLKSFLQFNYNIENDLKVYYLEQLVYDPVKRQIKIIDLSTLWYDNFLVKFEEHSHKDVSILSLPLNENTRQIISFEPKTESNDIKMEKYIRNTEENNKQYKIIYV